MNNLNKLPNENSEVFAKIDYTEFNKFQTYFYTNIVMFNQYTDFEIKKYAVQLLTNVAKGFPDLAKNILNIYSPQVVAIQSPAIIKALQRAKFVTGFGNARVPQFIYFKQNKAKPVPKKKGVRRKTTKGEEFTDDIIFEIQSILMYDSKDYEAFKFTPKVQQLGKMLIDNKGYNIL